VAREVFLSV
jgi:hypothetical protein